MENEKNMIIMVNQYLKVNIQMGKEMEKEKNMVVYLVILYLMENILMVKDMEKENNIMIHMINIIKFI